MARRTVQRIRVIHNLGVIARHAKRVFVMYAGRIVEKGSVKDIFGTPRHPYTIGLLWSVPRLDRLPKEKLVPIEGALPNLIDMPPTCGFFPRCRYATHACGEILWPSLKEVGDNHWTSCRLDVEKRDE